MRGRVAAWTVQVFACGENRMMEVDWLRAKDFLKKVKSENWQGDLGCMELGINEEGEAAFIGHFEEGRMGFVYEILLVKLRGIVAVFLLFTFGVWFCATLHFVIVELMLAGT
ncbi:unnamed protein product [Lathyrus sativus]|nr:unnamed protein product [Lathyrus sativus]